MAKHGRFVWNEINTRDPEAAKRFFGATLGWTFQAVPLPEGQTYWLLQADGEVVGGIFDMSDPMFDGIPEHLIAYVEVDDVDARVRKVAEAGGQVLREPWTVPGFGRIAIVRAVGGAVMGWKTTLPEAG
ncbi:MAG TPA: VOC family protein [Geminicoccus sp.]|jgi:hypothetical protein|uniref:VOC family protein n=1 Tax=Geminicoccus sp. TaxID=2024832 RepID=UPI002E37C46E|nr:VOC family protein [Geminicoccus sp.]HEX2527838.1 VOC family protein [Geminicoccus sp.]